uniref:methylmalonate-semialdehyde dehydrogenase (CoA acylating) n=1 Tax=Fagus sylvatica TaxID=28930 RepID=A0A2N9EFB0_FAGSY
MFPVAVTCGNTFILKPSEKDPGAAVMLAELAVEAGLPNGVLNLIHGSNEIVNAICDDDDIKAISFVGPNAFAVMKAIGSFNIYKAKMRITAFAEPYITCGWRKRTEIQGEQVIDYVTLFFSFVVRKILVGTGLLLHIVDQLFIYCSKAGTSVYARASAKGKRIQSNVGAKNHAVVMPDASVDATLNALVAAGFGAGGQKCMALSTVVFVGGLNPWEDKLVEHAKAIKVNAGTEPDADLGPVISKQVKEQICKLIQTGVDTGAKLVLDGRTIVVLSYVLPI